MENDAEGLTHKPPRCYGGPGLQAHHVPLLQAPPWRKTRGKEKICFQYKWRFCVRKKPCSPAVILAREARKGCQVKAQPLAAVSC